MHLISYMLYQQPECNRAIEMVCNFTKEYIPSHSAEFQDGYVERSTSFMDRYVYPAESIYAEQPGQHEGRVELHEITSICN